MTERKNGALVELIDRTWRLIDYISERLDDPAIDEKDKVRWAGVLASAIGTLDFTPNHSLTQADFVLVLMGYQPLSNWVTEN